MILRENSRNRALMLRLRNQLTVRLQNQKRMVRSPDGSDSKNGGRKILRRKNRLMRKTSLMRVLKKKNLKKKVADTEENMVRKAGNIMAEKENGGRNIMARKGKENGSITVEKTISKKL